MLILKILFYVLITDFLSVFFHWLEDCYGQENWPIIGEIITKPNILHHHNPRHFVRDSWWMRNRVLLFLAVNIILIAHLFHFFNWQIFIVILIGVNGNEIHCWTHQTPQENGRVIHFLQQVGIFQSPCHHTLHHLGNKNTHYCIITNWLNPFLEIVSFWRSLENLITKVWGVYPRSHSSFD